MTEICEFCGKTATIHLEDDKGKLIYAACGQCFDEGERTFTGRILEHYGVSV